MGKALKSRLRARSPSATFLLSPPSFVLVPFSGLVLHFPLYFPVASLLRGIRQAPAAVFPARTASPGASARGKALENRLRARSPSATFLLSPSSFVLVPFSGLVLHFPLYFPAASLLRGIRQAPAAVSSARTASPGTPAPGEGVLLQAPEHGPGKPGRSIFLPGLLHSLRCRPCPLLCRVHNRPGQLLKFLSFLVRSVSSASSTFSYNLICHFFFSPSFSETVPRGRKLPRGCPCLLLKILFQQLVQVAVISQLRLGESQVIQQVDILILHVRADSQQLLQLPIVAVLPG